MMKSKVFIEKLKKALNSNTVYALGTWGQPLTDSVINSKAKQLPTWYNKNLSKVKPYANKGYFAFDCVCLIKSILWGWDGNLNAANGGAKYGSNNVPDVNADGMIQRCSNVSTDFSKIVPGAAVWVPGHIGVYIGDGQVIECTASWTRRVLQSSLGNVNKTGQYVRTWNKWGKLPYVDYSDQQVAATPVTTPTNSAPSKKSVDEIAKEVIAGKWGSGATRKQKLTSAGYNYAEVQAKVNELCKKPSAPQPTKKSAEAIAREVIAGKWGSGATRKQKLQAAGYNYAEVQKIVNRLLK